MGEEIPWCAEVIDTPRDGSCFFSAIAMAMNDSISMWYSIDELRVPMEKYWQMYHEDTDESLCEVTSDLVRYMCGVSVDKIILELYNVEADWRIETEKVKAPKFKTPRELGYHMRKKTTWGDHAALHAFLKSLNYHCSVIVFDAEFGGMRYLPPEWTKNKKAYICLRFEDCHYGVVRLKHRDSEKKQLLCVTRKTIIDLITSINSFIDTDKAMELDSF